MKRSIVISSFLILLLFLSSASAFVLLNLPESQPPEIVFTDYDNYDSLWKKVDQLAIEGKNRSVVEEVEKILKQAEVENNVPQIVKALAYIARYSSIYTEDEWVKTVNRYETKTKAAKEPLKSILHSALGELHLQYFRNNQWRFYNRSNTAQFKKEDPLTWSLHDILRITKQHYDQSLTQAEQLQSISIRDYHAILNPMDLKGVQYQLRPSLFDLLAQRALNYYQFAWSANDQVVSNFLLDQEAFFGPIAAFSKLKVPTEDSSSQDWNSLGLYQQLLAFHLKRKDTAVLVDINLSRLQWLLQKSILEHKDSLYFKALKASKARFQRHEASAEIDFFIASFYRQRANRYLAEQNEDWRMDRKKAVDICTKAINSFPKSYGAQKCAVLLDELTTKTLQLTSESVYLPETKLLFRLAYANIRNVHFRIVRDDFPLFDQLNLSRAQIIQRLLNQPVLSSWSQKVDDGGDYLQHSLEVMSSGLKKGRYYLLASEDGTFESSRLSIAYTKFQVSALSYIAKNDHFEGGLLLYVLDRDNGSPEKEVKVEAFRRKYRKEGLDKVANGKTNKKGALRFKGIKDYRNYQLLFTKDGDSLASNGYYSSYNIRNRKATFRTSTYFFMDRAIYRPGQTIHFKGIMISSNGKEHKLLKNQSSKVRLLDVNGQELGELKLKTNEYGSFQGSFVLAASGLTGRYQLRNKSGSKRFQVEEYKRPRFEVSFDSIASSYQLNDTVLISGKAMSFGGSPLSDAAVKYRVYREARYPFWSPLRSYYPPANRKEIGKGEAKTNESGAFQIHFAALPDQLIPKKHRPVFHYSIEVDVVDINGETQSNQERVAIGYEPLIVQINLPSAINQKETQSHQIAVNNMAGVPQTVNGKISIWQLEAPKSYYKKKAWPKTDQQLIEASNYRKAFPHFAYQDEDQIQQWKKGKKVWEDSYQKQNTYTLSDDVWGEWEQGAYVMQFSAEDQSGNTVEREVRWELFNPKKKQLPIPKLDWFAPIKVKAEVGEMAQVLIGSSGKNARILYELEHDGSIIHREWLKVNNEQKLIELEVEEHCRGGFAMHFSWVYDDRFYTHSQFITVPHSNKKLQLQLTTFRDKVRPGSEENWQLKIKDAKGKGVSAEVLAAMYDVSLDQFARNHWSFSIFRRNNMRWRWKANQSFFSNSSSYYERNRPVRKLMPNRIYPELNWFGYVSIRDVFFENFAATESEYADNITLAEVMAPREVVALNKVAGVGSKRGRGKSRAKFDTSPRSNQINAQANERETKQETVAETSPSPKLMVRKNLQETAFFYPQLQTSPEGDLSINFKMPEALTRWKMMALAHNEALQSGQLLQEIVTQKELMVIPNPPRFLREGDQLQFSCKISSLSDKKQSGKATLQFFNAFNLQPLTLVKKEEQAQAFELAAKGNTAVSWTVNVPEDVQAVVYRIVAETADFSDGEEAALPVLSNRMLVTESMPLPMRSKGQKSFTFKRLQNNKSKTLKHHRLSLEFTPNPAWYAVQALPYMMEYPYECAEQTFSRFYANHLASHIAHSDPKIKAVFDQWRNQQPDALLSNLEKNQELKTLMLEETPWVRQAKDESERKRRIALLFDFNRMQREGKAALNKLKKAQRNTGGWPWFNGMRESRYITQHIVSGFGHLKQLGVLDLDQDTKQMIASALRYLDQELQEEYNKLVESGVDLEDSHLRQSHIQYLYARSFFPNIPQTKGTQIAYEYYFKECQSNWVNQSSYFKGMIALLMHRKKIDELPQKIIASLKESAVFHDELGMYWKGNRWGYRWYQAPIETQALLIEAFSEISEDQKSVEAMRLWLLKQKQTNDWKTTKATAAACYALLLNGMDLLQTEANVSITLGGKPLQLEEEDKEEVGTGYFKKSWGKNEIQAEMAEVVINKTSEGPAWGAMYWQYFEDLENISAAETPLQLKKKLFVERNSPKGKVIIPIEKEPIKVGDKVMVRIELRVDRNMSYVHLKDMRASGFEPINVISSYKYQDGLGYYESTRDAATNFFFDHLPRGTYVFEYPLRANIAGQYSNGIANISCMYAPEFRSHSEGLEVSIEAE